MYAVGVSSRQGVPADQMPGLPSLQLSGRTRRPLTLRPRNSRADRGAKTRTVVYGAGRETGEGSAVSDG